MALLLKLVCNSWRIQRLLLVKFFVMRISGKSLVNESLEHGCLITQFLETSGIEHVLLICLVEPLR